MYHDSLIHVIYKQRKGVGSATALRNRKERVEQTLKPLTTTHDLPLSLYPLALAKLSQTTEQQVQQKCGYFPDETFRLHTHNANDILFEALRKTLAPVLVANNGAIKKDGADSSRTATEFAKAMSVEDRKGDSESMCCSSPSFVLSDATTTYSFSLLLLLSSISF